MARKRWVSVNRAENYLYWECPYLCGNIIYYTIKDLRKSLILSTSCPECLRSYKVIAIGGISNSRARILMEEDNEV